MKSEYMNCQRSACCGKSEVCNESRSSGFVAMALTMTAVSLVICGIVVYFLHFMVG